MTTILPVIMRREYNIFISFYFGSVYLAGRPMMLMLMILLVFFLCRTDF